MTKAHMEYPGHVFPKTRAMARWLITIELVVMAPPTLWQIVRLLPTRRIDDFIPLALVALACHLFPIRALGYLEELEQAHGSPTGVMSFLLHLAAVLPLIGWVTIGMVLYAYAR